MWLIQEQTSLISSVPTHKACRKIPSTMRTVHLSAHVGSGRKRIFGGPSFRIINYQLCQFSDGCRNHEGDDWCALALVALLVVIATVKGKLAHHGDC
jgi:hypothetical protein